MDISRHTASRIVFHVPFKLGYALSGGGIRPGKLIAAFENLGYTVDVVSGDREKRVRAMREITERIASGEGYAFCYAETSVLPTMLTEKNQKPFYPFVDFIFFRELKKQGIPMGLFYRDIYWKFSYYKNQHPFLEQLRRKFFYHLDLWYYKRLLNSLFLPSSGLAQYLPASLERIAVECPPGHDVESEVKRPMPVSDEELDILYVGGISPPVYDITPLMRLGSRLPVTVCCREEEWRTYRPYYEAVAGNVVVRHLGGTELAELYAQKKLAAILRTDHEYLSFASPLKLYEAVGQNIPLLVSRGTKAADFVEENGIGWVVDNDFQELDTGLIVKEYPEKVDRLLAVKDRHHWRARAELIRSTLLGGG